METLLVFLTILVYVMVCVLTYTFCLLIKDVLSNDDIPGFINRMSVKTKNILIRVFILLGPITLIPSIVLFILILGLVPMTKDCFKWVIDVNTKNINL